MRSLQKMRNGKISYRRLHDGKIFKDKGFINALGIGVARSVVLWRLSLSKLEQSNEAKAEPRKAWPGAKAKGNARIKRNIK